MEKLTIWDYKNADVGSIQRVIKNFQWLYAFESDEKVQVLSEVLMNILCDPDSN